MPTGPAHARAKAAETAAKFRGWGGVRVGGRARMRPRTLGRLARFAG